MRLDFTAAKKFSANNAKGLELRSASLTRAVVFNTSGKGYEKVREAFSEYVKDEEAKGSEPDLGVIEMGSRLRQWFSSRVLGPDKPAVAKVKSLSIRKLVLKLELGINMADVRKYLALAQQQMLQDKRYSSLQIYFDVDPL